MAEPLKNQFGPEIPRAIAEMISGVWSEFPRQDFVRDVLRGYEPLDLMPRGWKIAEALRCHLPEDYNKAARILIDSLGPKHESTEEFGMWPFLYLPHVFFVGKYGLNHFELSMKAQYELTQRFTAEFSIRPYLEHHRDATLKRLALWAHDDSAHVRRLVSEGTRPRLPWAPRLREFQKDPSPVLKLLELLKDDPELYVRRSVANNLNDIGKDHPTILTKVAQAWLKGASEERQWLVKHALRSAVKRGEPGALKVLGFGQVADVQVSDVAIKPKRAAIGGAVTIACVIKNHTTKKQRVLVDLCIHFVKANGKSSPKVFKLTALELEPREAAQLQKKISLKEMTTRRHYPGKHRVELLINGVSRPIGEFLVST